MACYICFPYISTMRKTILMFEFRSDPLEFHNSVIHCISGLGTWCTRFCRKKACYICFPYILTMRKTNLMLKLSLDPLEFHNSGIRGIAGIRPWRTKFCCKKACYMCFPYILTMRKTNLKSKFLGSNLWNSVIPEFMKSLKFGQELCSIYFCSAKIKNAVLNLIYSLV